MPKGPNGEKRPADAIGLEVLTGKRWPESERAARGVS